ncbi:methylthioribulose-1-phosphate dehydratase [Sorangium cellulosum]|uniref:Methylthioribulose-1-phosphate dehydratase n=1 Tax=Sorangium cellulosum TaxID=56 RepID=A0A4P2PVX2_SORCE|nr:methylthioribulose 1-phosphate dehydratase [Sorangium cellulosum]AUX20907.1 methylthioribulose-1-phosphate dehydratase [Sorangium cellulosum]
MSAEGTSFASVAADLIALSRWCCERGWTPATSGNFSARLGEGTFAITASGRPKGALGPSDIVVVDADGRLARPAAGRPSAETLLHCQLYRRSSAIGAVAHTHSRAATVLSRGALRAGYVTISGYELGKALSGVTTHDEAVLLPVFANTQDIARLAEEVEALMSAHPPVHGYLIAGHGLYTWGASVADVRRHVEALEFLLDCALLEGRSA